ncbi:guanine nucleotide-binding protein-like 3 isoform X2 [Heterodontus francisci]|uniref:guanine nucleotide-binding protein-like 3 isoform X2 n=1 Tax=Heterodontus francisci TaxID=7792 RepID=UPI00355C60BF
MKRPKLKKASKRLSCHKRFKIQRKVREHKRKVRKEAKKQGNKSKKSRKDPGVPNSAPFKEAILREAEQRKQDLEELKQKQKLARQKEVAKKRKLEAKKDPEINEKQHKRAALKQQKKVAKLEGKSPRKSLCSELNKVLDASNVVLEVVDARDPLGYRCPQVEQAVLQSDGKKQLVLVLNKIDLVPKENAEKWLKYLGNEFPIVVFKSSTQLQDRTMEQRKISKLNTGIEISHSNTCAGSESLLKLLGSYCRKQDLKNIKVGLVGFPNVGKSSIINSLKKMRACNVGQVRGLTKSMQEVHIDKQIKVLDSPSIIASPLNPAVALSLRNIVDIEALENPLAVVEPILKNCNKQQVMLQYNVPDFRTSLEFLTLLARKRSMLKKGGIPDVEKAAKLILYDWTGAKVSYHTHPPERHKLPTYITANFVDEVKRGFNTGELTKGNENTLKAVRCPNMASSIVFQSTGPTNGLIEEDNVGEEMQDQKVDEEEDDCSVDQENSKAEYVEIDQDRNGKLDADRCPRAKMLQVKRMEAPSKKRQLESEKIADPSQKPISIDFSCEKPMEDEYDFNTDYVEDPSAMPISSL